MRNALGLLAQIILTMLNSSEAADVCEAETSSEAFAVHLDLARVSVIACMMCIADGLSAAIVLAGMSGTGTTQAGGSAE